MDHPQRQLQPGRRLSSERHWRQRGTMIAHSGGVGALTGKRPSTMALIEAKDAAGAMLPGSPGTRVDSNGYAILPYLRPVPD
ncbi:fimbria/pilus outer membrane usher protein [Hafnia alvei]|uniref:fimbria/pilus outer membrane usher protein n=1 Tax=Hafnia alvei TaxID=569 RepID=UPI00214CB253|nr:fimbria/pilus outer membrane usher protein [Hafnia alvei]